MANTLHGNVTALAAGMMYRYAVERDNQAMRDTALLYGNRVKTWVEQLPSRLRTGNWAMSGGTLMWGMCNSIWKDDTVAGKNWLAVFGDSVPYFMPSGQWNCSWNIWDANAFRAAAEINHDPRYLQYHQRLTDTLLARDQDDDGGIPATWTDPQNQDQTWVSMYLDFMGMDRFTEPMYDYDAGVIGITPTDPSRIYLPGDSLTVSCSVTNFGREDLPSVPVTIRMPDYEHTDTTNLGFLQLDTVGFGSFPLALPGMIPIAGFTSVPGRPAAGQRYRLCRGPGLGPARDSRPSARLALRPALCRTRRAVPGNRHHTVPHRRRGFLRRVLAHRH